MNVSILYLLYQNTDTFW